MWIKDLIDRFWRYDAFISYSHKDGAKFAKCLHKRLEERPILQVCLDTEGEAFTPGVDLKQETQRRVMMSRYLILVATREALSSPWVAMEVRLSLKFRRSPIVIDIDDALEKAPDPYGLRQLTHDLLTIHTSPTDSDSGPTTEVVAEVRRAIHGARQTIIRQVWLTAVGLGLVTLLILLFFAAFREKQEANRVAATRWANEAREVKERLPEQALLLALTSVRRLWDGNGGQLAESEQVLRDLLSETGGLRLQEIGPVTDVAFAPKDDLLAVALADSSDISIWKLGKVPWRSDRTLPHEGVQSLAFHPDSNLLISGGGNEIRVWKSMLEPIRYDPFSGLNLDAPPDGRVQLPYGLRPSGGLTFDSVKDLAFNPSGECFGVATREGRLYFLNPAGLINQTPRRIEDQELSNEVPSAQFRPTLDLELDGVAALAFSPDGSRLATGSTSEAEVPGRSTGLLRVWKVTCSTADLLFEKVLSAEATSVAFDQSGRYVAAAARDGITRIWELDHPDNLPILIRGAVPVREITFGFRGNVLAVASGKHAIDQWSWRGPEPSNRLVRGHEGFVNALAFDRSGKILATGSADKTVRIWSQPSEDQEPRVLDSEPDLADVQALSFSPDGRGLAVAREDGSCRLHSLRKPYAVAAPSIEKNGCSGVLTFDPAGDYLATVRREISSPDGEWLLRLGPPTELWRIADGRRSGYLLRQPERSERNEFDPAADMEELRAWREDAVAAFSDHELAIGMTTGQILVFSLRGQPRKMFPPFRIPGQSEVIVLGLSKDGRWLACAGRIPIPALASSLPEYVVWLWDLRYPQREPVSLRHQGAVTQLHFSSNSELIATVESGKIVRVWRTKADDILKLGCRLVGRPFSSDEARSLGIDTLNPCADILGPRPVWPHPNW